MRSLRPRHHVLAALVFGLLVTFGTLVIHDLRFAYRLPTLHLVLETAEGMIALLAAWLMLGRFTRDHKLSQLLLITALVMLGLANLLLSVLPPLAGVDSTDPFSTWTPLIVRSAATILIAIAALTEDLVVGTWWRDIKRPLALAMLFTAAVAASVSGLERFFGAPDLVTPPAGQSGGALISGLDAVLVSQVLLALLWGVAAYGFTKKAEATDDEFATWLGAASAVSATARISYLMFPSLYTGYVYVGDFLRLVFHILLLGAAMREIRSYWVQVAAQATEQERRRLARDLHDGIAQELLFVSAQTRAARQLSQDDQMDRSLLRLQNASDRAVDEARRAIHAMSLATDESLASALRHMVDYMDSRVTASVSFSGDMSVDVAPARREDLIRIVREAVVNAHKHSGSEVIEVRLLGDGPPRIVVTDRGSGFDVSAPTDHEGFGLVSMRERARAIGAELEIRTDGRGTTVEVRL